MNEGIELHDSAIAAISVNEVSLALSFSHVYLHRSSGHAGRDAGGVYVQPAVLTFVVASAAPLPTDLSAWISEGFLRIDDTVYDNLIPAGGSFEGAIEFSVTLTTAETLTIQAKQVHIQLQGEPRYLEEFAP